MQVMVSGVPCDIEEGGMVCTLAVPCFTCAYLLRVVIEGMAKVINILSPFLVCDHMQVTYM